MSGAEVAPGVHRIDTPLGERLCSLYLFTGSGAVALFDVGIDGTVSAHVLPYLAELGLPPHRVTHIVVSHCDVDHFGGLADARAGLPNATVVAHRLDADAISHYSVFEEQRARGFRAPYGWDEDPDVLAWTREVTREAPVDERIDGSVRLDLGDRVLDLLHVPGHSSGHLAVHDSSADVVAISDAVLGDAVPFADGRPAFPPTYRYVDDYLATIELIAQLGPGLLLTAHYPTYRGAEVAAFLAQSRNFAEQLDDAVLAELNEAPDGLTVPDLVRRLNGRVGDWPAAGTDGALVYPVVGHVERGLARGSLRRREDRAGVAVFEVAR